MSKIVAAAAIRGARRVVEEAEEFLNKAISEKGKDQKVEFPETAFFLPMAYALLGIEVRTLGDIVPVLEEAKALLREEPSDSLWLPYLGDALDSGIATLLGEEIIVAIRYLYGQEPQPDCVGFYTDTWMRSYGIQLVDGRMPGFAAILGAAPTSKLAVEVVRELQKRNIICFVGSNHNGRSIIDQLKEENVQMGWETYIVPYGRDTISAIYPLNWAIRAALTFGGLKKGEALKCLKYCQNRVFAFGLTLGELDDVKYATGAGAMNMGFPVIADTDIPEIRPTGICTYEHLVKELDHKKLVPTCIQVRGVKVKVTEIPIPVAYSAAFEGETVRKEQMYVQFGGKYSTAFEYVTSRDLNDVEDGKIELIGPEIDDAQEGGAMPLGIYVKVAGRKMQKDFEPILERQIHSFINEAMGIFHMGQRDLCWLRISKEANKKGFKIRHFGTIIHARLHDTFGAIVDKAQVTIYTRQKDVERYLSEAKKAYEERDERMAGMTDESVDTFYSCTLCVPKGELIVLADGSFDKIENVIDTVADERDVEVLSFEDPHLTTRPIRELFVNPAPRKLVKITLFNGNSVTLTKNHRLLTDTKQGLDWVEAGKIKRGDYLLAPKQTLVDEMNNKSSGRSICLIDLVSDAIKVYDGEFIAWLRSQVLTKYKTLKEAANQIGLKYKRLSYGLRKHLTGPPLRLHLSEVKLILRALNQDWGRLKSIILELGNIRGQRLKKSVLDEDFMYLAGLMAADGTIRYDTRSKEVLPLRFTFTNSEYVLIRKFREIVSKYFDGKCRIWVKPRYQPHHKKTWIAEVYAPVIGSIMVNLGVRPANRSVKWTGEIISQLPSAFVASFLRGLFDGDGHVGKRGVSISAKGYKESQHIYLLLKKLGISSNIRKVMGCYEVSVENRIEFGRFVTIISSWHPRKKRLMKGVKFQPDKYHVIRTDTVPWLCGKMVRKLFSVFGIVKSKLSSIDRGIVDDWMNGKYRISKEKLTLLIDEIRPQVDTKYNVFKKLYEWVKSKINFEKVKNVEIIEYDKKEVYNFSVPGTHNYLVNGIVVSNCQSFAPNHVCIVKPERLGLCGAYSYIDAKASFELNPTGPNQPVKKGECLDPVRGEWKGVNDFIYQKSNKTLERFHGYSIISCPETSCGCFECIIAILPETNGFMIVNREFAGMTPIGMTFSTLAGSVGGGAQTPGFMGIGRLYIVSRKFISADGGIRRIVWMTKELKEALGDKFKKRCEEEGIPELIDKIADETVATTTEELLSYLQKVKHPALKMEPLV